MAALDEQVALATEAIPGIAALSVFGSRATGTARPDSDLDVAVLPAGGASRRHLQVAVAVALADLAPEGRVDVILLDEAPELLRHQVLATGRLVLCRDARAWRDLRVQTMREHGDREWVRDLLRRATAEARERGERWSIGTRCPVAWTHSKPTWLSCGPSRPPAATSSCVSSPR